MVFSLLQGRSRVEHVVDENDDGLPQGNIEMTKENDYSEESVEDIAKVFVHFTNLKSFYRGLKYLKIFVWLFHFIIKC